MQENFDDALQRTLVWEGGFSDHPQDPGGATMKGVTLRTFQDFFGADKTVDDLKNITPAQLASLYRTNYWDKCSGDQLPSGVDFAVFDVAVNSGPGRAAKFLQAAVGANQDGAIGPGTLGLVGAAAPAAMINAVCDERLSFLQSLNTFATFGAGWTTRVNGVRQQALAMAGVVVPNMDFETVKLGSSGPWVVKLQEALHLSADGNFGPATNTALKQFQTSHGLTADGIAGRNTYRALGLLP